VLTPDGWELWYQRHHVPEKTRSLINAIRCSGLTPVGGGSSNVWGRYPSKNMGSPFSSIVIGLNWQPFTRWSTTPRWPNISISLRRSNWFMQFREGDKWGYYTRRTSLSFAITKPGGKNGKPKKNFNT